MSGVQEVIVEGQLNVPALFNHSGAQVLICETDYKVSVLFQSFQKSVLY